MKNDLPATVLRADLPAIGAEFLGGIFAGVSLDNDVAVALVLLPKEKRTTWDAAVQWAAGQGGALPSRIDQIVLFKNVRDQFEYAWYWSGEQPAEHSEYAWGQGFSSGSQSYGHQGHENRARAVRRVPIQ